MAYTFSNLEEVKPLHSLSFNMTHHGMFRVIPIGMHLTYFDWLYIYIYATCTGRLSSFLFLDLATEHGVSWCILLIDNHRQISQNNSSSLAISFSQMSVNCKGHTFFHKDGTMSTAPLWNPQLYGNFILYVRSSNRCLSKRSSFVGFIPSLHHNCLYIYESVSIQWAPGERLYWQYCKWTRKMSWYI